MFKVDASLEGRMVVKEATIVFPMMERETPNLLRDGRFHVVEMRRLELLTPYMRTKNEIRRVGCRCEENPDK